MPDMPVLMVNQFYGSGSNDPTNGVSHSFIELYNPTSAPIDLSNFAIHVQTNADVDPLPANIPWVPHQIVTTLPGNLLQPNHSFLIRGASSSSDITPFYTIPNTGPGSADMNLPTLALSNRAVAVALVSGPTRMTPLTSPEIASGDWSRVQDLVGAFNTGGTRDRVDNFLTAPIGNNGISRSRSVRRTAFADTRNNDADFRSI
jgi:hypothetical protein